MRLTKRGIVKVKGKGDVNTYWLNEHLTPQKETTEKLEQAHRRRSLNKTNNETNKENQIGKETKPKISLPNFKNVIQNIENNKLQSKNESKESIENFEEISLHKRNSILVLEKNASNNIHLPKISNILNNNVSNQTEKSSTIKNEEFSHEINKLNKANNIHLIKS